MASFMEKEALIEKLNGVIGMISVACTIEEFKANSDMRSLVARERELKSIPHQDIDYGTEARMLDAIGAQYAG